ncbi:hypothetical protein EPAKOI_004838 [Cupriavidus sp. H18C2]
MATGAEPTIKPSAPPPPPPPPLAANARLSKAPSPPTPPLCPGAVPAAPAVLPGTVMYWLMPPWPPAALRAPPPPPVPSPSSTVGPFWPDAPWAKPPNPPGVGALYPPAPPLPPAACTGVAARDIERMETAPAMARKHGCSPAARRKRFVMQICGRPGRRPFFPARPPAGCQLRTRHRRFSSCGRAPVRTVVAWASTPAMHKEAILEAGFSQLRRWKDTLCRPVTLMPALVVAFERLRFSGSDARRMGCDSGQPRRLIGAVTRHRSPSTPPPTAYTPIVPSPLHELWNTLLPSASLLACLPIPAGRRCSGR